MNTSFLFIRIILSAFLVLLLGAGLVFAQQAETSPNEIGGYNGNMVTSGVIGATISGGGAENFPNVVYDHYGTIGGGQDNYVGSPTSSLSDGNFATVCGGDSNQANGAGATVGGGLSNLATQNNATISGGYHNTASADIASVGGGQYNQASAWYSTIGGGQSNKASGTASTVGGGQFNQVSGMYAAVGGGFSNSASNRYASVGGGQSNQASGLYATVGGGSGNQASVYGSAIGGGSNNVASGQTATVPGGYYNMAEGSSSFAAGQRAHAVHDGAFVWADNSSAADYFASTGVNQFNVRATGGMRLVLAIDGTGNPTWTCSAVDGSSWSCSSDRALKENLVLAKPQQALQQLAQVPVYYWNAKGGGARHIGPMAQDFVAAFSVGENNTSLATIDLDGAALAAIQGLYAENQELKAQVEELEARLTALEQAGGAARTPEASQSSWVSQRTLNPTYGLLAGLGLAGVVVWRRRSTRGGQ